MQDYLCDRTSSKEFPSVEKIQKARGTEDMPTPDQFAIKFDESLDKILSIKSGTFIDLRKL